MEILDNMADLPILRNLVSHSGSFPPLNFDSSALCFPELYYFSGCVGLLKLSPKLGGYLLSRTMLL
jgi:hypothetical protein